MIGKERQLTSNNYPLSFDLKNIKTQQQKYKMERRMEWKRKEEGGRGKEPHLPTLQTLFKLGFCSLV